MKYSLLDIIVCPKCKSSFKIDISLSKKDESIEEIIEGKLICEENHIYPIIDGIPRLLSDLEKIDIKTIEIFGYEWKRFADYSADNLSSFLYPFKDDIFLGKNILDAGCGAGRHLAKIANSGAHIIVGMDISDACEVAYKRVKNLPNTHIVQADISRVLFKEVFFNFICSFGVLHHLSSPFDGFRNLTKLLVPGGEILIVVYKRTYRKFFLEVIRLFTKKMPKDVRITISFLCAILDYGLFIKLYKFIKRFSLIYRMMDRFIPSHIREYAKYNFQINFADWHDRLSAPISTSFNEKDIENWFIATKFSCIDIRSIGSSWVRGYGKKL